FSLYSLNLTFILMKEPLRAYYGSGKCLLSALLFSLFLFNPSWAETFNGNKISMISEIEATVDVVISGTVNDQSGEAMPGVTVSVPGTTIGTATDLNGSYSLSVPEGSTLVFSFIGYE